MAKAAAPSKSVTRLLILLGNPLYEKSVVQAVGDLKSQFGKDIEITHYVVLEEGARAKLDYGKIERSIQNSDIVLLDKMSNEHPNLISLIEKYKNERTTLGLSVPGPVMARIMNMGSLSADSFGGRREAPKGLARIGSIFSGASVTFSSDGLKVKRSWLAPATGFLQFGKQKHIQNYIKVYRYWQFGTRDNLKQMILFLAREYGGLKKVKVEDPKVLPTAAAYHPDAPETFNDASHYIAWYRKNREFKGRPTVGMLFYMKHYVTGNTGYLDKLVRELEGRKVNVFPVMCEGINNMEALRSFFLTNGASRIDALVSFPLFRLAGGPAGGDYQACIEDLQKLNVPLLKPITMVSTPIDDWNESPTGVSPIYTTLAVALPELDGAIEPIMAAGFKTGKGKDDVGELAPIEGRIEKIASRAVAWATLRKKNNAEKKVAFILYNYPPGKASVGNAAYLDVFASLINVLDRMKKAGYDVGTYPGTSRDFLRLITQRNLGNIDKTTWTNIERASRNAFLVEGAQYDEWYSELPQKLRDSMEAEWGKPPGDVMKSGNSLLIPALKFGNILVGFQPARGWGQDITKAYHDRAMPPHHQYLAFYRWVERVFQADAMVHFGTHGTLEFLPGKQVGLSDTCFPDAILPEVPNIYLYIVTGSSEGTIAKRRVYATLVNYNTPPMRVSSAYSGYAELEDYISAYHDIAALSEERGHAAKEQILEKARELKLIDQEQEDYSLDTLYDRIIEMKSSMIPRGVHVIGKELTKEDETDYLLAMLRFDRGDVSSLQRLLCASRQIDWDIARKQPSARTNSGKIYGEILNMVDKEARTLVGEVVTAGKPLAPVLEQLGLKLSRDHHDQLQRTLEFGRQVGQNLKASPSMEVESILRALNGEYILPGTGGDPVRSPDILPTGRNMVGFDARRVPTKIAEERAAVITKQILEDYRNEHSGYPESVGVVLFSLEVMQTHGESVAEILQLIGVRPVRSEAGFSDFSRFTIIPLEELGRPRIDVAVDISGIFRDTFPELLQFLGKVIKAVAELDEPPDKNFIRKHSLEIERNLIAAGQSESDAREFSKVRTFGVGAGSYGTNISRMIASSEWQGEKEIAELYLDKQSHFYGDGFYDKKNPQALNEILKHVSVCAQVRSTSLYGISDLDHYYEHLGGFTSSVGHIQNKKPVVMVADSSSEKVVTRRLGKQLEVEARTRFLNDGWIAGMLESGSRGMKIMADRAEHMVGWAATTKDVDTRIFKELAQKYVFDDATRKKIMQENPWTLNDIMRKLMEAYQRGYWQATKEELDRAKQIYLELEEEIEEREV